MYGREIKGNTAKACGYNVRVSTKNSKPVCKALRGMEVQKAKKFLNELITEKSHINGKYYTNISSELLGLIESAEKNAEFKNLDTKNMFIAHVAALKGSTMRRRRHKNKIGNKLKATHLEVILKERSAEGRPLKPAKKAEEKKEAVKKEEAKTEKLVEHKEIAKVETKKEMPEAKKEKKIEAKKEEMKETIKEKVKAEAKKTETKHAKEPGEKSEKPKEVMKVAKKPAEAKN